MSDASDNRFYREKQEPPTSKTLLDTPLVAGLRDLAKAGTPWCEMAITEIGRLERELRQANSLYAHEGHARMVLMEEISKLRAADEPAAPASNEVVENLDAMFSGATQSLEVRASEWRIVKASLDAWRIMAQGRAKVIKELEGDLQVARLQLEAKRSTAVEPSEPLCPRPCSGRPDGFTMAACILADECGCTAAACEARASAPSTAWRPIEDRAFPDSHAFLVYCPERSNAYAVYRKTAFYGERFLIWGAFETFLQEAPSHWMPLPGRPVTKEADRIAGRHAYLMGEADEKPGHTSARINITPEEWQQAADWAARTATGKSVARSFATDPAASGELRADQRHAVETSACPHCGSSPYATERGRCEECGKFKEGDGGYR